MTNIRVTPEQLNTLSGRVNGSAGSLDSEMRALSAALAPLGSDWAGVAQARYTELWNQWQTSAQQLNQALQGIGQLLGQAGSSYAQAEQAIAASFGR